MNLVGKIHTYFLDCFMKNFENDPESDFGKNWDRWRLCSVKNIVIVFQSVRGFSDVSLIQSA